MGAGADRARDVHPATPRRLDGVPGVPELRPSPDPRVLVLADAGAPVLADVLAGRTGDRPGRLAGPEVVALGERLARILAAVHEAGVTHHDLHPGNVLLAADGRVELIDFDLATTLAEVRPAFTHHREILGRLPYLAPEQTGRTGSAIDRRSDLYALGAVLYEAATGRPPFTEQDALELVREILTREPTPVGQLDPGVPAALDAVISRLLEKEPDRRYQSAAGVAHDLARVAADPAAVFPLGERDFPSRLAPPTRLVGRDTEMAALATTVDAIARPSRLPGSRPPACRVVLVGGGPGVGKSALVDTLRPMVTRRGGWFVAGKADQVVADSSAGLHTALRRLARLLLAEPPAALEAQARVLRQRLGSNATALIAVVPDFARVLGQPPDPGDMSERELEDRTRRAVIELLRAVASPTRPLVLVLDDIQWAPAGALDVLDAIVGDPVITGLMLVGIYRDGDVDAARLAAMTAGWVRSGVVPTTLHLTPLAREDLAILLGQVLRIPAERTDALVGVIGERAGGNPFDTVELLNSLRDHGALEQTDDGWAWDVAAIGRHVGRGDVVALIAARIEDLGPAAAQVLGAMSCLGGEVSTVDLATGCGLTAAELDARLARPMETGLVTPVRHDQPGREVELRFRHDRVQQAALARLGADERRALQAGMGMRLAAAGRDLLAAEQLLAAGTTPASPEEVRLLVRVYRAAADEERRRTNFTVAEQYLGAAARILLDEPAPAAERELVAVATDRHQLLYLLGRLDEADGAYAWLSTRVEDGPALAHATAVQVASLTNRQQYAAAIDLGLDMLARLGVAFPTEGGEPQIARDLAGVMAWTATLGTAGDDRRPTLSDRGGAALAAVMSTLSAPAFFSDRLLSAWLVIRARRLWEDHGPHSDLVEVLAHGASAFVTVLDEFRAGQVLLRHLVAVGEAHHWERAVAHTRFLHTVSCAHWFEPLDACHLAAEEARDGLLHLGDLPQASWAYYPLVVSSLETAPHLDHPLAELAAASTMAERAGNVRLRECYRIISRFCRAARGPTVDAPGDSPGARDHTAEALIDDVPLVRTYFRIYHSIAAALAGDREQLAAHSRSAYRLATGFPELVFTLLAAVPFGLDLGLQLRRATPGDGTHAELLAELDEVLARLRRRAADQPDNILHLLHHLEGERAWALGDHDAALTCLDAALSAVGRLSRPWHHALIARRAGELHRELGMAHSGLLHLVEARQALLDWGAGALAAKLEDAHPVLTDHAVWPADHPSFATSPSPAGFTSDTIDTTAVLRVCQALAAQTTMNQLHGVIVDQLSAITGASAVHIVLRDEDAGWRVRDSTGEAPGLDAATTGALLPRSAVRYVLRTQKALMVNDATTDDRFAHDPYLAGRQRLALLVVPVLRSGDLRAVIVLENHLTSGTFTADRLGIVTTLTGQLAVAIDNAQLYASLERRIAERTEELHAANAQLERLSATDGLTGVANRRSFDVALAAEWTRSHSRPVSVVMVDVDHFKKYNDHLGHPAGDACLIEVSRLLAASLRDTDVLYRYGGEEFAAVLPRSDLETAVGVAERMRRAVESAALPHAPSVGEVTVSVGVATSLGSPVRPVSELLEQADAALYDAKHAGRNCVRAPRPDMGRLSGVRP